MVQGWSRDYRGYFFKVTTDRVASIWCPQWPNEARRWPNRQRKYGWPTTAIIKEVGCHVVYYANYPACRNDEYRYRLPFSVAEVILLESWTSVQQIVYHMLRFFAKRELIAKDCPKEDEVLCTYHLKTLMLWTCEEMLPELWNSLSVIKLCSNLLKKLVKWLQDAHFPNYFNPQENLFHNHFDLNIVDEIAKKITSYCDSNILSLWFAENYMPSGLRRVFDASRTRAVLRCDFLVHMRKLMKAKYAESIDACFSIGFLDSRLRTATSRLSDGYVCDT